MLLEQHSSSEASGASRGSRRRLARNVDWNHGETPVAQRFVMWLAFSFTILIALILLLGG